MILFLSSNHVIWSSKKQQIVSQSSTKVEYHASVNTTLELV